MGTRLEKDEAEGNGTNSVLILVELLSHTLGMEAICVLSGRCGGN